MRRAVVVNTISFIHGVVYQGTGVWDAPKAEGTQRCRR